MFEPFECRCIYVEITNRNVPKSGCIEYCALTCTACRNIDDMIEGNRAVVSREIRVPRNRMVH